MIALMSLLWEFVVEGFLSLDGHEDFSNKIEDVWATIVIACLALAYPTYKGLSIIRNWKELEKTLINQEMQSDNIENKKLASPDSINIILMDELHRRKKAAEIIKNERHKFFNMLDQLPICFHLQADDYTVPFANKMFKKRFGSPDTGLCHQLMHNRSKPCEPCSTFRIFDSHETESNVWTSQDGKTYLTVVTPFEDVDGSILIMEMAIDITSEQKAKNDLEHVLAEQEEHIKQRTLELERSNNALKEFSTFAAHDLKEPLRKILVFSGRIQEVIDVEPGGIAQQYLDGMGRSAERMNSLIDDLLKLSQVASQGTNFRKVDLNKVVAEVIEDLEPNYPDSRKNISVQSLPKVDADKTQMYQLFKNLLSNSLKYAKTDEPPRISIEVEINSDGHHLIAIRDNGIGFDEIYKEKIFKPFERLHGRSQYSGTGIGLAICKKVVESHNGELDVESQMNVGSTFTIRLPKSS
jgi:signal transduction histidine kinase